MDATAYAAKLSNGRTSLIVLNKDSDKDLALTLDFGTGASGKIETEALNAPALDSREAHITPASKRDSLKGGKYIVTVPHASGLRITLS